MINEFDKILDLINVQCIKLDSKTGRLSNTEIINKILDLEELITKNPTLLEEELDTTSNLEIKDIFLTKSRFIEHPNVLTYITKSGEPYCSVQFKSGHFIKDPNLLKLVVPGTGKKVIHYYLNHAKYISKRRIKFLLSKKFDNLLDSEGNTIAHYLARKTKDIYIHIPRNKLFLRNHRGETVAHVIVKNIPVIVNPIINYQKNLQIFTNILSYKPSNNSLDSDFPSFPWDSEDKEILSLSDYNGITVGHLLAERFLITKKMLIDEELLKYTTKDGKNIIDYFFKNLFFEESEYTNNITTLKPLEPEIAIKYIDKNHELYYYLKKSTYLKRIYENLTNNNIKEEIKHGKNN